MAPTRATARSGPPPTPEQRAITQHVFAPTDIVHIIARAGTGKTTTLVQLARAIQERDPDATLLYVVYNVEARKHAEKIMPTSVDVRTLHSLALEVVKGVFASRGLPEPRPVSYVQRSSLLAVFDNEDEIEALAPAARAARRACVSALRAAAAMAWFADVFECFLKDTQRTIDAAYVRSKLWATQKRHKKLSKRLASLEAPFTLALALAWNAMASGRLPITFDGLTKVMFMVKPDITKRYGYALVDEAQDFSPQYLDIMMQSRGKMPIVWVGDPHQRVYEWLGTVNVFAVTEPTATYDLSASFRFSQELADLAGGITGARIVGAAKRQTRIVVEKVPRTLPAKYAFGAGSILYLHRTNVDLLMHAVEVATAHPRMTLSILGRGRGVLSEVSSLVEMYRDKRWMFDLRFDEAIDRGDESLAKMLEWVAGAPNEVEGIVAALQERVGSTMDAEAVFATVHSSKGLESDVVVLSDALLPKTSREYLLRCEWTSARTALRGVDTPAATRRRAELDAAEAAEKTDTEDAEPDAARRSSHPPIDESPEWRLLYVAQTRAKGLLVVPPLMHRAMRKRARHLAALAAKETARKERRAAKRAARDGSTGAATRAEQSATSPEAVRALRQHAATLKREREDEDEDVFFAAEAARSSAARADAENAEAEAYLRDASEAEGRAAKRARA